VAGYGDFLLENPRYGKMRAAKGLEEQAAALQASGYATDPNYGSTVLSIAKGIPYAGSTSDYARGALGGGYGGRLEEGLPAQSEYAAGAVTGSYGANPLAREYQAQQPKQNALAQAPQLSMSYLDPRMFQRELNPLALQPITLGGPYG
jgi:hypothetical protein